jgi:excinuclease ABC subunit C
VSASGDPAAEVQGSIDREALLRSLPPRPGVYRMLDERGEVLYVGKARNLRSRVGSYFSKSELPVKTRRLMERVRDVSITVTRSEDEALLLENNLIKSLRPRYNVVLRDDKTYPYIHLSTEHDFPRLSFYRGPRAAPGRYFGPYPSAGAVRAALNQLQRLFKIRQCDDAFFRSRLRPCLQYQIKRCTAPCVGKVDKPAYADDVRHAVMFLEGRNREVVDELAERMDQASERLDYEQAAYYRDQIARMRRVLEQQYVSTDGGDIDVIAGLVREGVACVEVFYIRGGHNLGNKTFYPRHPKDATAADIVSAFLAQYYIGRDPPDEILVNEEPDDLELIREVLGKSSARRVRIQARVRGERARWVQMAVDNAEHTLRAHLSSRARMAERFADLQEALGLEALPQRLECFDISHTGGEAAVASCVVFDQDGPVKADYRRFNIEDVTPGDDYGALRQALTRRYLRLKKGEAKLPDILFIDGGKGQLAQAEAVLRELQVSGLVTVGVAKGRERKPGNETLFIAGHGTTALRLPPDSPALQLIQQIRDEAHRFALTGHRGRRARTRNRSPLEDIPGIGPGRRRVLLRQLGGLQGICRATVEELSRLPGISRELAQRIYDTFHEKLD